jgi:hypothetical protein
VLVVLVLQHTPADEQLPEAQHTMFCSVPHTEVPGLQHTCLSSG